MAEKAFSKGGNAVIGTQYTVTPPRNLNDMIVVGTGTAVVLQKD